MLFFNLVIVFMVGCVLCDEKKSKHMLFSNGVQQATNPSGGYNVYNGYNRRPGNGYNRFIGLGGYNTGYYPSVYPQNQ